jgi:hypothetical protein
LVVKSDKSIKLSINPMEVSEFSINKYIENNKNERNDFRREEMEE